MINDPNYETRTLIAAFDEGPIVSTFLRDTFFGGREYPPTNLVEFDFRRGRRKMAPFVAPLIGGKVMEREGYETRFYRAPRIAPVRNLRIPDLEPRMFNETIYQGRSPADRAAEMVADDAVYCDEAITRREEWMCREILVNGKLTVTADHGFTEVIDFMESAAGVPNNHEPVTIKWDQVNSTPLADLERARLNTIRDSGIAPNVALFGINAAAVFMRHPEVIKYFNLLNVTLGSIEPIIQSDSVVRFGRVPGLELYTYAEYFEDDMGVLFPMLPSNFVMLLSNSVQNKIVYGAFTQLEDAKAKRYVTYQASRIPFVYGDEENGHLFYRLTSCPLPMPTDVMGWRIIEALPPAVGLMREGGEGGEGPEAQEFDPENPLAQQTAEGRPYFKPETGETAHEKNMPDVAKELKEQYGAAHPERETEGSAGKGAGGKGEAENLEDRTVDELKEIADKEGVEVKSDAHKADIIKAIRRGRRQK